MAHEDPTRRTALKVGLLAGTSPVWAPPVITVMGLTPAYAQTPSAPQPTAFRYLVSHGILLFKVGATYYAVQFTGTSSADVQAANPTFDVPYLLAGPCKGNVLIAKANQGTAAQRAMWQTLKGQVSVGLVKSAAGGSAWQLTSAPSSLVGAFMMDGSFPGSASEPPYQIKPAVQQGGRFLFYKTTK